MFYKDGEKRAGRARFLRKFRQTAGILVLAGILYLVSHPEVPGGMKREASLTEQAVLEEGGEASEASQGLTVHYLNVEKCNCVLVESSDGHFMLIDAGSNDEIYTAQIVKYLQEQGVKTLDYLLITHPHKDHVRAVPQLIQRFAVDEVLMGDFDVEMVGTKTFERAMDALERKGLPISRPQPGETRSLGNASFTILINDDSEETAREELNDCSMGLIVTDGFHRFLFYGDGEEKAENGLLNSGFDLKCDVMMVAHHGSKSSTSQEILDAAKPQIAVISCGIDGDGEMQEPSKKVLKRLQENNVTTYRTDQDGTVVIQSTADGLRVIRENKEREADEASAAIKETSRHCGMPAGQFFCAEMNRTGLLCIRRLPLNHGLQRLQGSLPISRASCKVISVAFSMPLQSDFA